MSQKQLTLEERYEIKALLQTGTSKDRNFPKKTSFENLKKQDIKFVEHRLNNRPRKTLEFKTPAQCFLDSHIALGT